MNSVVTLAPTKPARDSLERAAAAEGLSLEDFILRAAEQRARDVAEAQAFFAARAMGADFAAFDRIMNRNGGEPPRPGDEPA